MMARMSPEDQREITEQAQVLVAQHMALKDIRKALRKTQVAVAKELGIKQENVARIEQRSDMLLSTLRTYVRALGGRLSISIRLPDLPPVEVEGLGDLAPVEPSVVEPPRAVRRTPVARKTAATALKPKPPAKKAPEQTARAAGRQRRPAKPARRSPVAG
ncbi:XRE family transcriptional regulator [Roseicella aquatilis]|uniref:XRE family transcriptional regulator n=2 Tax=Roseicella aquatilis TaxID=2527868 RepID=A0A4V2WLM1_9PROT|nr:XRE family transcriptional regulator [Roseicella aquatilis]